MTLDHVPVLLVTGFEGAFGKSFRDLLIKTVTKEGRVTGEIDAVSCQRVSEIFDN
jgi:hypothetical protein